MEWDEDVERPPRVCRLSKARVHDEDGEYSLIRSFDLRDGESYAVAGADQIRSRIRRRRKKTRLRYEMCNVPS
jgi:hypothetical protein